ncbi:MAG: family 78 glycoside hydrolase catalytic domain [Kiritimatiellae bacterium]|nr:family 78 glycoside hydrolase catalytic domain [Kiritimatiellia bacterium]
MTCLCVAALAASVAGAAAFVSPQEKSPADGAAAVFEKSFVNDRAVRRATWGVTAQGVFEAFANGRRVGDDFLKPGITECGICRHVYCYDVTGMLDCRAGATNVLSATVTPGWWCDQMMRPPAEKPKWQKDFKQEWQLGKEIAFYGELRLEFDNGSAQAVGTDKSWLAAYTGPVVSAGIYEGEVYDARRKVEGLKPVRRNTEFTGELRPAVAKVTLREDLVLKPREMWVVCGADGASADAFGVARVVRRCKDGEDVRLDPGEMLVVDFGQNCSAVPSFDVTGESGTALEIRTSEMLNESHGEKSRGNDGPAGTPYLASLREAYAGIRYMLKDGPQSYMPRYTYFGYRYLGVTATGPVVFARWRSTPVSSVTKGMERGSIVTGNDRVNRLVGNIRWGMLSNYLSSPTDCPQRDERLGWTADTQVFMNSAAYLADTREFLGKFLADLRDAQRANGCYMCFVPNVRHTTDPWASAGWTDAGVIVPYRLWKWYGERRFVDESWDSMVRYMDFLESDAEPYRINHGDWLAFEHHEKPAGDLTDDAMDDRQVKALNAYFRVWMAMLMREMAAATGRAEAARHYAEEEAKLRKAFAAEYVGPDGTIKDEYKGQCNDLYMLKLGLCGNAAAVEATKRDLIANIKAHGNRLQTGFLGTAILLPTLTFEADAPDLAYSLLLQDAFPSWLYSVDQGATTVWERWNGYTKEKGFGPVGMNSFNHYAYGCVLEWLFSAAAGIRPDPEHGGWRRFRLRPYPDRRLGSCSATYRSGFGVIRSAWRYDDAGRLVWQFSVPPGSVALVSGLDGTSREYAAGDYELSGAPDRWQELNAAAREQAKTPVRAGVPGVRPFWNGHSKAFMHPPAFDFKEIGGVKEYRYRIGRNREQSAEVEWLKDWTAVKPWIPVPADIWDSLAPGYYTLKVEGSGERSFYRAAVFRGPYPSGACDYRDAARKVYAAVFNMLQVQGWRTSDDPPKGYDLYCYPAKILSSMIRALCRHAKAEPKDSADALAIARKMADWLIAHSQPAGTPLAHFPPTYWGDRRDVAVKYAGQHMLHYPAHAAHAYLDLAEATRDGKYRDAALDIVRSYMRLQGEDGTWPLKVSEKDGSPVRANRLVPSRYVLGAFDRAFAATGDAAFAAARDRAFGYVLKGPATNWNWDGQFEDMDPMPPYRNMQKGVAVDTALSLFSLGRNAEACEIVDWCEDQFVVWSDPIHNMDWKNWKTPTALEQYDYYTPIDASMGDMIGAFAAAYKATGNGLFIEKAKALADNVTRHQRADGTIPTYFDSRNGSDWVNCMVYVADRLEFLASVESCQ